MPAVYCYAGNAEAQIMALFNKKTRMLTRTYYFKLYVLSVFYK
jgi:hypothetical protein